MNEELSPTNHQEQLHTGKSFIEKNVGIFRRLEENLWPSTLEPLERRTLLSSCDLERVCEGVENG